MYCFDWMVINALHGQRGAWTGILYWDHLLLFHEIKFHELKTKILYWLCFLLISLLVSCAWSELARRSDWVHASWLCFYCIMVPKMKIKRFFLKEVFTTYCSGLYVRLETQTTSFPPENNSVFICNSYVIIYCYTTCERSPLSLQWFGSCLDFSRS